MEDTTRKFTALDSKAEMKEILSSVYNSLMVKGYNPINGAGADLSGEKVR